MTCKECRKQFVEALYGELNSGQRAEFEAHLQDCAACAAEYGRLQQTLRIMDQREQPRLESDFGDVFWDKLAAKLDAEDAPPAARPPQRETPARVLRMFDWPRASRIAAAAAVLVIGVLIGRYFFSRGGEEIPLAGSRETLLQPTALEVRAGDYLEKSKVLLLGLVNWEAETPEAVALDFPRYQRASRDLLQEAGYLKTALEDSRQRRLRALVADLEVVLLQIANLEAENDLSAIEMVKTGVDRRGILLKINLEEIRRAQSLPRPGRTSGKPSI